MRHAPHKHPFANHWDGTPLRLLLLSLIASSVFTSTTFADDPTAAEQEIASEAKFVDWPPSNPETFLKRWKKRDAEFDNRILKIEERSKEHVDPRGLQARIQFSDFKFGKRHVQYPDPNTLPDAYVQPHRRLRKLIVREPEVTIRFLGDLERQLNPKYGSTLNKGTISTNVGGNHWLYSPETKKLKLSSASGGTLRKRQSAYEWCMGYGFAKLIHSIKSIEAKNDRVVVKGAARVFQMGDSTIEIELDRDLIVRRAVVSTSGGFNEYRVTTDGAVRPAGAPAIAEHGVRQHVLMSAGKPEREDTRSRYDIGFVSLSPPLSAEEYAAAVELKPASGKK